MQRRFDWKAAFGAGLIAGTAFILLQCTLTAFFGHGTFWAPLRMIAGMTLWKSVVPPPGGFALGVVLMGLVNHFVLALLYAMVFAFAMSFLRFGTALTVAAGVVWATMLYLANFYVFWEAWRWFEHARSWITIVDHAVFGAVLGWSYAALWRPAPSPTG